MNRTESIALVNVPPVEPATEGTAVVVTVALLMLLIGSGLAVAGVYHLWGTGWALLTAAPAPIVLAVILFKGLMLEQNCLPVSGAQHTGARHG